MYSAHLLIYGNTTWHTSDMSELFRMEEILFPINLTACTLFRNDDDDDDDEEDDEDEDEDDEDEK